jgi:hypothetical protein
MRLIGLHSRLQGGKDTAYETIDKAAVEEGALAVRRAFADPLKTSGLRSLGVPVGTDSETVLALANKIKESGRITVTYEEISEHGNLVPRGFTITGRQFWQWYGTEAHRADDLGHSFGQDFWVENLLPLGTVNRTVIAQEGRDLIPDERPLWWDSFKESWAGFADIAVVTDVRFPNEAKRILEHGGEVWWIYADERLGPNTDGHASEQRLPDEFITKTIDNNGTLAQFQNNVLEALNS